MLNWAQIRKQAVDVAVEPPRIDPKRPLAHLSDAELQTFQERARAKLAALAASAQRR